MHSQTFIILGPTASGKTAFAIKLAKEKNGEIISADSMQVYRGMDIGTAKPTMEERQGIPHHLINIKNPDEEWTVSDFVREAQILISEIRDNGKTPIIAGGTGLYLWALINGFSFPITPADKALRRTLEQEESSELFSRLKLVDPDAAKKIHPNDKKRIIRALEVNELTGMPISKLQRTRSTEHRIPNTEIIGLNLPREKLYQKIEERVDRMIKNGLVEEVKELQEKGYGKELPSMQALGYKEVIEYLERKYTLDEMIATLKKNTRHFARRQMTWFRRFDNVNWIEV